MLGVHIAHVLSLRLDVYVVRLLGSLAQVGTYALASQISELLLHLGRAFKIVVFSGAARGCDARGLHVRALMGWIVASACMLPLVLVGAHHGIFQRFFGDTAVGFEPALLLRIPGALATALTLVVTGGFLGRGQVGLALRANLLPVPVFLVLVWPLALAWEPATAAASAFSIAAVVQVIWVGRAMRNGSAMFSPSNGTWT